MIDKRMFQLFLTLVLLVTITNLTLSQPRQAHIPGTPAGISQLVENRAGRVSCWGVVINLGGSRFKKNIDPQQIEIREAKHGHDLRSIMSWRGGQLGKKLIIKFKPGMGDFGTGNRVEIRIDRSSLVKPAGSANEYFQWVIDTDVLL